MLPIKRLTMAILMAALASLMCGCENYKVSPENSDFSVACIAEDGTVSNGVELTILLNARTTDGDCKLSLSMKDVASGASIVDYTLLLNGQTRIGDNDIWSFDEYGAARFVIKGLPAGEYTANAVVSRWYHTSSSSVNFTINQ